MSKDEFLLDNIEKWWACIRDSEISEGLAGADGTDPKDVKKFYHKYDTDKDDGKIVGQLRKDVRQLFIKLRKALKQT